jgi:hypothetical protein
MNIFTDGVRGSTPVEGPRNSIMELFSAAGYSLFSHEDGYLISKLSPGFLYKDIVSLDS